MTTEMLQKINQIDQALQALKLEEFFKLPTKRLKEFGIYPADSLLSELRKERRKIWNEKYSKEI